MHKCRCPITSWGNPILRVTQTAESQAPLAFPDGMVGEHRLVRPPGPWHPPAPLGSFLTQQQIDQKTHKNKNQNHTNQNNPHKKSKGQGEEPNITASHLGRGMGSGEVVTYASAKVQKKKKKKRGNDKLLHSAQHKVQTRSSCLGSEVMVSNSLVSNPCQGCPGPSPILANTSLAEQGSASLAALVLPAPSSGWTRLLATSLPPNQLVLWGSTFYLKAEGCLFSVQRGFCRHHRRPCHTLPPGGELAQANRALGGPGFAPPSLHPQASPSFTLGTQGSHHNSCFVTAPPAADPNWDRLGKHQRWAKSNQSAWCPGD